MRRKTPMHRKSPRGSRHESWCAVFRGKSCDCDDAGGHREPRRRQPPLGGGGAPPKKRERELEDA
jgi:hypothetical protein